MAKVAITANQWTSVITTTADTAVQNKSGRAITVVTGSTSGVDRDAGTHMNPEDVIVFASGVTVSAYIIGQDGLVTTTLLGPAA